MATRPNGDEAPPSTIQIVLLVVGIIVAVTGIKHFDHQGQSVDPHTSIYLVSAR